MEFPLGLVQFLSPPHWENSMKRKEEDIQPWILDLTKASYDTANRKFCERIGKPPTEWWDLLAWGDNKLFHVEMIEAAVQQQSARILTYSPEIIRILLILMRSWPCPECEKTGKGPSKHDDGCPIVAVLYNAGVVKKCVACEGSGLETAQCWTGGPAPSVKSRTTQCRSCGGCGYEDARSDPQ